MIFGAANLAALSAVLREGSFERAAKALHVTPSAVSQRIKQLEEQIGAVLVVRASPCVATPVGQGVFRHALQVELLERDLIRSIAPQSLESPDTAHAPPVQLAIAVNADSLATWLIPALAAFARHTHARVDVVVDDENHTASWLRSGRVLGAVTSQATAVQGCRAHPLGVMRYLATATPRFARQWFPKGPTAASLLAAPSLAYDRNDRLCRRFIDELAGRSEGQLRPHLLPSPNAYVAACLEHLAWGMNPEPLAMNLLRRGRLVDLVPGRSVDVPLFWQQWSISSPSVDALADALTRHAEASLHPA